MRKLLLFVLAFFASTAFAEIYSWKDADGKIHYSDQEPGGNNPSLKTLQLPPDNPGPARVPSGRKASAASQSPAKSIEEDRAAARKAQLACEKAKADLQTFQDSPRRTAVSKGPKGKTKFYALDGEERATEEEDLQKAVADNCK